MASIGNDQYSFDMNTAEVVDGNYDISIIAKDYKGNEDSITFSLNFDNCRTRESPALGILGFSFYISMIGFASIIFQRRKIKSN